MAPATYVTEMPLIPTPRMMRTDGSSAVLGAIGRIGEGSAAAACDESGVLMMEIRRDIETYAGLRWRVGRGDPGECDVRLDIDGSIGGQAYRLDVTRQVDGRASVDIVGGDGGGLRHGVQTLRQLLRYAAPTIPVVHIEDAPALPVRAYYLDVTRGRVPTLDTLKSLVDILELHKYNQLQLYVEHTFRFDGLSQAWRGADALDADDILALDEYCARAGIELVPSISTFGHQYMALRTDRYAELGEFPEQVGRPFSFVERMEHHTLNPLLEGSLELVERMIDQYAPLFRSRKFNICADETFDLGKGRSKARAQAEGVGVLYAGYLTELCAYLERRGLQPMMWADIAVGHPEALDRLRGKGVLLNWQYEPDVDESRTAMVAATGARQYVCPAVHCWNAIMPRIDAAWNNISRMAGYGVAHHAEGILITDWGDYGHINDPWMSVPGLCYGAQCGWNGGTCDRQATDEAIDRLVYGAQGGFVELLRNASERVSFGWDDAVRYLELDLHAYDSGAHQPELNDDVAAVCAPGDGGRADADCGETERSRRRLLSAMAPRLQGVPERDPELAAIGEELAASVRDMRFGRARTGASVALAIEGTRVLNWAGYLLWRFHTCGDTDMDTRVPPAASVAERMEIWFEGMSAQWKATSRESELRRVADVVWALADEVRRTDTAAA